MEKNNLTTKLVMDKLTQELTAILTHKENNEEVLKFCVEAFVNSIGKTINYCGHRIIIKEVDEVKREVKFEILLSPILGDAIIGQPLHSCMIDDASFVDDGIDKGDKLRKEGKRCSSCVLFKKYDCPYENTATEEGVCGYWRGKRVI